MSTYFMAMQTNRRRPAIVALILSALLAGGCASAPDGADLPPGSEGDSSFDGSAKATSSSTTAATSAAAIRRFDGDRAMYHVWKLAKKIGVRRRASRGEWLGSRYIADRFRSFGYNVKIQKFSVDDDTSRNVVAWWPDVINDPFVIGAHMDSVPRAPGANDNASGTAVMLEIARLIAGTDKTKFIRFVAFGSEEYGTDGRHHVGSQVFVARRTNRSRKRTPGMISVDMIADGRPLLVGNSGIAHDVVARSLYRKINRAGIGVEYRTLCDCSDNGPFELAGIPAAFMWSGPEPNYHSPSDTVANMKRSHLVRSGRAVRVFVKALDWDLIWKFRRY